MINIPEDVGMINTELVDASITNLIIDMLDNYTVYEVNVSAITIEVGPAATETERTGENGEYISFPCLTLYANTLDTL